MDLRLTIVRPLTAVPRTAVFFVAACIFAAIALQAAWIPLKAQLAQLLLQQSWARQLQGETVRPWPWADTHAVAELRVSRLQVRQIVLAGSSGRNLAFGPALSSGDAKMQDWIINGHRDTHFRFLQQLQIGDELQLQTVQGLQHFRVNHLEIIDSRNYELVLEPDVQRLSLVTCYPFDAIAAGGPLRYVVTALPVAAENLSEPTSSSG